jgi:hypothetical protein
MSWLKRDEPDLPERLKNMTPEQIEAAIVEADTLKAKNAELETRLQGVDSRFETFTQETNSRLDRLNERLTPQQQRQQDGQRQEPTSFLVDGDQAFNERVAPLYGAVLTIGQENAKNAALRAAMARQKSQKNNIDGLLFERFDSEIADLAKSCTPQQLANSATWEHLFYNVKGRHTDEIAEQNREGKGEFFVENGQRSLPTDVPATDKLTPQEAKIAKSMGIKEEDYLARRKQMVVGVPEEMIR